jgi:hypothetical protein
MTRCTNSSYQRSESVAFPSAKVTAFLVILLMAFAPFAGAQSVRKINPALHQAPTGRLSLPTTQTPTTTAQQTTTRPAVVSKASLQQFVKKLSLSQKTMGPKVTNPRVSVRSPGQGNMLVTLQRQMSAATTERAQIMSTSSSSSGNPAAGSGLGQGKSSTSNLARSVGRTSPTAVVTSVIGQPSSLPHPPQIQGGQPEPCFPPRLKILTINGGAPQSVVFTPDQQYNLYTIKGCHFGAQQGQMFLIGTFKGYKVPLNIVLWNDGQIIAAMDPNLTGEPDQIHTVKLFLVRADGQQLETDNTSFYAVRQSITLVSIPQAWTTLGSVSDVSGAALTPLYQTGVSSNGVTYSSATVSRGSTDRFSGGQDYFDLSRVSSQFSVDSIQLEYPNAHAACTSDYYAGQNTIYIDAYPSAQWDGDGIRVYPGGITCHNSDLGDRAYSLYTLQVQVTGPRGVDPTQP